MTHDEARELIGAAPGEVSTELQAHLQTCPEGQAFRDEMLAFESTLRGALELDWPPAQDAARPAGPVPKLPPVTTPEPRKASEPTKASVTALHAKTRTPVVKQSRPRLFALAASVAAAIVVGGVLWLTRAPEALATEVVTHVEGEPHSWQQTEAVPAEKLEAVLRKSGVALGAGMQPVVYASSCWFRGHYVPHFVVSTQDGPVTVLILVHEHVDSAEPFNADGYTGLLVPAHNGTIAVLSRTPMDLENPAARVVHALQTAN